MRVTEEVFLRDVTQAAGPEGVVERLVVDGDPRRPARIHALFASPGDAHSRATIAFLHGKGGAGREFRCDAVRALREGFNVLVPELRAHAPSTGDLISYGYHESIDLSLLLSAAASRFGLDPAWLGIDGCSMGSVIALKHAAETQAVRGLWLQSPFGDLPRMALHYLHRATGLPQALLSLPARLVLASVKRSTGIPLEELDPAVLAPRVRCPVTVIHGEDDTLVPLAFVPRLYEALPEPKDLWILPRCGHCHHVDEPQALHARVYAERWTRFFRAALDRDPAQRAGSVTPVRGSRTPSRRRPS
ncbi:MAG: alpha/beta hydrolase [Acidobacteria bacterium]|nr:alpha/beta hydrolase [Acidobacteriota bacterium]